MGEPQHTVSQRRFDNQNSRAFLSRKLRDIKRNIGILYNDLEAHYFDLRYGTDTIGKVPVSGLPGTYGENIARGTGYQATNARHFRSVLCSLDLPPGSRFIDVGSGKGKALLLAAEFNFAKVVGIELSSALCHMARQNVLAYKEKVNLGSDIEIIETDAMDYEIHDHDNVFFLNNPFDGYLTHQFLEKIRASTEKKPRKIWLIYGNPVSAHIVDRQGSFVAEKKFEFRGPGRNMVVYVNRAFGWFCLLVATQFDSTILSM